MTKNLIIHTLFWIGIFFSAFAIIDNSPLSLTRSQALADDNDTEGDKIRSDILLEEFMYGEEWVTIAARHKQKREEVPSAVYVITAEDIKQSGVTRLADVFRIAPGLDVVTVDGNSSIVSIRGFAIDTLGVNGISNISEFSKRLLVLVDGRPIYNPAFGGVFWDQEPIFLEDIERIEIIRGPGAALYGANAVNGVINIITKDPEFSHGGLITATYGTQETLFGNITYANNICNFHYKITGGYREDDGFDDGFQVNDIDDFKDFKRDQKVNFRGKYKFSEDMDLDIFAGLLDGAEGEQFGGQAFFNSRNFNTSTTRDMTQAFFQTRFNKEFSETSNLHLQFFSNLSDTDEADTIIRDAEGEPFFVLQPFEMQVRQYDVELQHSFALGAKNLITWGANYRNNQLWSRLSGSTTEFEEEIAEGETRQKFKQENMDIFGLFFQDDFKILDNLALTIGVKSERDSFTGTNLSPRASLVFSPWGHHSFRLSYSRAFRTPTFFEDSGFFSAGFFVKKDGINPVTLGQIGNEDLRPERLDAFELGYQGRFLNKLELNIETYFNLYKDLITLVSDDLNPGEPFTLSNTSRAEVSGVEVSIKYPFTAWLSTYANYSFINFNAKISDDSLEKGDPEDSTPQQKANMGLRFAFKNGFSANLNLHYTDQIMVFDEFIDNYLRVDLRLAQKFMEGRGEIAIIGQNLLDDNHPEFIDAEVERTVFVGLGIQF